MEIKKQTAKSFSEKWHNNRQLAFDETLREGSDILNWILSRNGFSSTVELRKWLAGRDRVLDAGCGNGRVTALLRKYSDIHTQIVGIDLTASHIAEENLSDEANVHFEKRDLLEDLSGLGKFDLIYCQEVLHHTANPEGAFQNLTRQLVDGGEIAIYVYKIKAPVREYSDDLIRGKISTKSYDEAMIAMRQITELGRILSELNVNVTVPDVEVLGIQAGTYDIQRFIYHHFAKCFWNPDMDFSANAAINYDWYHPQLCTRHTLEEVELWFHSAGLKIIHRHVDPYGITVRGIKES